MIVFGRWIEPSTTKAKHTPMLAPFRLKFCIGELDEICFPVMERRSAIDSKKSVEESK